MNGSNNWSLLGIVEWLGPAIGGALTFIVLLYFKTAVLGLIVDDLISVGNLYSAVFGWAAIQTGCLYAIYGYVAGKTDGRAGLGNLNKAISGVSA